jgi:hypothetical protein
MISAASLSHAARCASVLVMTAEKVLLWKFRTPQRSKMQVFQSVSSDAMGELAVAGSYAMVLLREIMKPSDLIASGF